MKIVADIACLSQHLGGCLLCLLAICTMSVDRAGGQNLEAERASLSRLINEEKLKEGCLSGDCREETGRYYFSVQDALYQGDFRGGLPHGFGICQYGNGEKYIGKWHGGYFYGKGVLTTKDGTVVSGIWQDGRLVKTVSQTQLYSDASPGEKRGKIGEVYAIVVGISSYPDLPGLKYADDDAYRMFAHLRSPEGGAVPEDHFELLIDDRATKSNIEHALRKMSKKAGPSDRIVLFFSGHGHQDAFLPYDSDGFQKILSHAWIQSIFSESDSENKLIFADACLSRQGLQHAERLKAPSSLLSTSGKGTVVLLSSRMSETSLESDGLRQGVFSYFLFRGLSGAADLDRDQGVTIGELYRYVSRHVVEYTSGLQHPILAGDLKDPLVISKK